MFDLTALVLLSTITGLVVGWHLFSSDANRLKKPAKTLDPPKSTNS